MKRSNAARRLVIAPRRMACDVRGLECDLALLKVGAPLLISFFTRLEPFPRLHSIMRLTNAPR